MKKKSMITGAALAAISLVTAGTYFLAPSGYISLDLNPSVEIRTNRLDRVTSVDGVNSDGKALLDGYRLTDRELEDVVEDIVDRMVLHGYLGNERDADILVTVEEGTVKPETLKKVNTDIESYLEYRSVQANVMGQGITADDDLVKAAKEHSISVGKMSVIQRLVEGDKSLTAEELSSTSLKELIAYAEEKNIPLEFLEDRIDEIDDDKLDHLEDGLDDYDDNDDNDDMDDRDDNDDNDDADDRDDDDGDDDIDDRDDNDDADDRTDNDGNDDADDRDDNDDADDRDDTDDNDDMDDHDDNDDMDDRDDDNDNADDRDDDNDDADDRDDDDDDADDRDDTYNNVDDHDDDNDDDDNDDDDNDDNNDDDDNDDDNDD